MSLRPLPLVLAASCLALSIASLALGSCGPKKPAASGSTDAITADPDDASAVEITGPEGDGGEAPPAAAKKDDCTGFDIANLDEPLNKSTCEVPNSTEPGKDMKDKLEVKVSASPAKVQPGGSVELVVSFTNKSKELLALNFRIDPTPRYEIEVSNAKKKRVDQPAGKPPTPKKPVTRPPEADPKTARITLAPNGTARMKLPLWIASSMRWAPEKLQGSLERGFPRAPGKPLPKGKYTIRVVTPLIGVFEGVEREVSAPKVEIEVGG